MKVSVVIVAFKKPLIIKDVIEHSIKQNFDSFEIIVVNNNIIDSDEYLFVKEQCEVFKDVIMVCTDALVNANTARNLGLKSAKGEYVKFLDDDDFLFEDALDILYRNAINNNSDVVFTRIIHKKLNTSTKIMIFIYNILMFIPNFIYFKSNMNVRLLCTQRIDRNPNTLNTLIKKSFLIDNGAWREDYNKADDAELFIRLSRNGKFTSSKKNIGVYNHVAKVVNKENKKAALDCTLKIVEENLDVIQKFNIQKKIACFYHYYLFDLPHFFSSYQKNLYKTIFKGGKK